MSDQERQPGLFGDLGSADAAYVSESLVSRYATIMQAPTLFAEWMSTHIANDNKYGRKVFRYHPRSDIHSKILCNLIKDDLLNCSSLIAEHAEKGVIAGGTNVKYTFPNGKVKTLDLAIGEPVEPLGPTTGERLIEVRSLKNLRISCEAKQCMTEHGKTKPRLFDELSSSHEIVHQGDPNAIASGIAVINIAKEFASPLRQTNGDGPIHFSKHRQPRVTEGMVNHLRGLLIREPGTAVGFDAFATLVINCDNIGTCSLHLGQPAPQLGDVDHYETFISRIVSRYEANFS